MMATSCGEDIDKRKQLTKALQERPQGALPSNTVPNPREQINSITTRSGLTTTEPSIPPHVPPSPREEVEQEPRTLMDEIQNNTTMMLLNGSKSGNGDEHQPKLSNLFKNFDYNGGGRWWLKGGDGGEVLQASSLKNNPLKGSTLSGLICVG
ncbi:hypothetical protein Tco_0557909 [Tanacetum coccineum]